MIRVELVRAWPRRYESATVDIADDAQVGDALEAAGWRLDAEFTGFHSVSLTYESDGDGWAGGWTLSGGIANLFDELPPAASSTAVGTQGNSILASQYTEAYYGRRAFVRLSKSF